MVPPNRTTAATADPALAPPSPRDAQGKPPQSARSGSWQRPRYRSGGRPSSPRRPPATPNRRLRNKCRPVRPPLPPRPLPCRPAPGRSPGCAKYRGCCPGQPRQGPWHASGAGGRPRAGPRRLAKDRHGRSGRQAGRQPRRQQQAKQHPHEPPQSRTRPRPPSPRGGHAPSAPRCPDARRWASRYRSCSGVWCRRGGTAIGRGGLPGTEARRKGRRATEGGW